MKFIYDNLILEINNGVATYTAGNISFKEDSYFEPYFTIRRDRKDVKVLFSDAYSISKELVENALFSGVRTTYSGFSFDSKFSFSTLCAIEKNRHCFHVELCPGTECSERLHTFSYPRPVEFEKIREDWYTVLTVGEGALIPNNSQQDLRLDHRWDLDVGLMNGRSNTMPWYGLVRGQEGFMALCLDDRDAGFYYSKAPGEAIHNENIFYSELGRISYPRRMRYQVFEQADYNTFCSVYKKHLKETGEFVSLRMKEARNPHVRVLNSGGLVHTYIHMHVVDDCEIRHIKTPKEIEDMVPFEVKTRQVRELYRKGLRNTTIHVDGWINKGYDNQHPDVFPVCREAGGEKAFKQFVAACHECGYLVVIHDQYRDFYLDAPSYDQKFSMVDIDDEIPLLSIWDGGRQEFLCCRFSGYFVDRNFDRVEKEGIPIDGAYLDVFSCMHLDECYHPEHPMTRRENLELRKACFESVKARGKIVQSEELLSWSAPVLDFCHHSPYQEVTIPDDNYLLGRPTGETIGIPVPLTSLCYHDSIVIPWADYKTGFPYMGTGYLPCILYGGIPYVDIEASQKKIDEINRILELHDRIKYSEMVSHHFMDREGFVQKVRYANGIEVTVDFKKGTYQVEE